MTRTLFDAMLLGGMIFGVAFVARPQNPEPEIQHVKRIPNTTNPEILYWFFSPNELKDHAYVRDLARIADSGVFDMTFLTQREGTDFYDFPTMHPVFKDLVARAHAQGIKVGLQLWTDDKRVPADEAQGIVVEKELMLDATGQADTTMESRQVRLLGNSEDVPRVCLSSDLLHVYAFQKAAEGEYLPGSLADISGLASAIPDAGCSLAVHIQGSPKLAGYTAYVMTVHYHRYPDMFSKFMQDSFVDAMKEYRDVGFDGAALDEFGYMALQKGPNEPFRGRLYSNNMAAFFKQHTGQDLIKTLFEMRYAPKGNPRPRVRAINHYFDVLRQGPLRVERKFFEATREIFGPQAFHGLHDTFHNHLTGDDIWTTGLNWWEVPRDYGQTDESTPMTIRLGIGLAHPKPVEYNQYYSRSTRSFLEEAINDARFNVRVHYHALNDQHGWGIDLRDSELLRAVSAVEEKVRLLNHFDAPRPAMNVLYLFGYPALANWLPIESQRNDWDINGNLKAEEKAVAAWNAGYRGALAPSYLIDEGKITGDGHGGIVYGGRRFTAVVYIGPEYSKPSTLRLLESFTAGGGRLMLDGNATEDFSGHDITDRFRKLAQSAVATSFDVNSMAKLGIPKLAIDGGALYEDSSVVLADLDSLLNEQPKPFSIRLDGHVFSGAYIGLLALKTDAQGRVVKLAAGGLRELKSDEKTVVAMNKPSDVVLLRHANGSYTGIVRGDATITIQ